MKTKMKIISLSKLDNNPWNPNEMSPSMFRRVKSSLKKYGSVQPPLVRRVGKRYQIIDGEHRVKAMKRLGYEKTRCCLILGKLSDSDAKTLTLVLGDVHGENNAEKHSKAVQELLQEYSPEDLTELLPMDVEVLQEMLEIQGGPNLDEVDIDHDEIDDVNVNLDHDPAEKHEPLKIVEFAMSQSTFESWKEAEQVAKKKLLKGPHKTREAVLSAILWLFLKMTNEDGIEPAMPLDHSL